jgi:hypothetical protein
MVELDVEELVDSDSSFQCNGSWNVDLPFRLVNFQCD